MTDPFLAPPKEREIVARYRTRCAKCDAWIDPGMPIRFSSEYSKAEHTECADYPDPQPGDWE